MPFLICFIFIEQNTTGDLDAHREPSSPNAGTPTHTPTHAHKHTHTYTRTRTQTHAKSFVRKAGWPSTACVIAGSPSLSRPLLSGQYHGKKATHKRTQTYAHTFAPTRERTDGPARPKRNATHARTNAQRMAQTNARAHTHAQTRARTDAHARARARRARTHAHARE